MLLSIIVISILVIINTGSIEIREQKNSKGFNDVNEIQKQYRSDIELLVQTGIMGGYEDNTFRPKKKMTRAEFAKVAGLLTKYSEKEGNSNKSGFRDVPERHWAKGYINHCKEKGYINGVGEEKFAPEKEITIKEVLIILDRIMPEYREYRDIADKEKATAEEATAEATRERIAKSVYEAIFRKRYSDTYGEKELGFEEVKGIIVANEDTYIETDESGERLPGKVETTEVGKSLIYIKGKYEILNRAVPKELIGEKIEFLSYPAKNGEIGIASDLLIKRTFEHEEFKRELVLIKQSSYDNELRKATAELEFMELTLEDGNYEITKVPGGENLEDFKDNQKAGSVYRYKEEDGKIDLSISPGPIHLQEPADIMTRNGILYINGELQWVSGLADVIVYYQTATDGGKCVPVPGSMIGIFDLRHECAKDIQNGKQKKVLLNSVLYEENAPIIRGIVFTSSLNS